MDRQFESIETLESSISQTLIKEPKTSVTFIREKTRETGKDITFDVGEAISSPQDNSSFAFTGAIQSPNKETLQEFYYSSFGYEHTDWKNLENISAKIIEITDTGIIADCLIDKDLQQYQKRVFPRRHFNSVENLHIGRLFLIRIYERTAEYRVKFAFDKGLVNESDFQLENLFEGIKDSPFFSPPPKRSEHKTTISSSKNKKRKR